MDIAMVGLGKMGANMARRLMRGGHRVFAYDLNKDSVNQIAKEGAVGVDSLEVLSEQLEAPRVVWVMVPSGEPTQQTLDELSNHLSQGDILIDGGNSNYKDTMERAATLMAKGFDFVDVGTSGGVWGLSEGYSMMVGGEEKIVEHIAPILKTLAPDPEKGWGRVGLAGAGHYVKMVHNGIEYGLMQAYAEGFELMGEKTEFNLQLPEIAEIWRHGSVVRSWLLDLISRALAENPTLDDIAAHVPDSGEGRWTVIEAVEMGVSIPVIAASLQRRFQSRNDSPFSDRLLAAMRDQFGGHGVKKTK